MGTFPLSLKECTASELLKAREAACQISKLLSKQDWNTQDGMELTKPLNTIHKLEEIK